MHPGEQTKKEVEFGLQSCFPERTASNSATIRDRLLRRARRQNFGHDGFVFTGNHAGISPKQENGTRLPVDHEENRFLTQRPGSASFG